MTGAPTRFPTRRWMRFTKRGVDYEVIPHDPRASFYIAGGHLRYFPYFWHYHPEVELGLVLHGRGTRIVGDSIEHFEEGDMCFLGSNLPHCWFSDATHRPPARSAVIQFRAEIFGEQFLGLPEMKTIQELLTRAKRGLHVSGRTQGAIARKVLSMMRRPIGHWEQIHDLIWILGTLAESNDCQPLATAGLQPMTNPVGRRKINQILELTNVATTELPSQHAVAAAVRLSPAAFSRFFKQSMGQTYMDYVISLRIARACRALLETDRSITEIAYESGFTSLSNFNRQFRQIKGLPPRDYRRAFVTPRTGAITSLKS